MNLTVTGHHVEVTSSMRNYVSDKLRRLQRHSENLFEVQVILSVEKVRQKAEATIQVALIRHKEKQKNHRRMRPLQLEPAESLGV